MLNKNKDCQINFDNLFFTNITKKIKNITKTFRQNYIFYSFQKYIILMLKYMQYYGIVTIEEYNNCDFDFVYLCNAFEIIFK